MIVAFSGIDGSGKTTQAKLLAGWFGTAKLIHFPNYATCTGKLIKAMLEDRLRLSSPSKFLGSVLRHTAPLSQNPDAKLIFQALQTINRYELYDEILTGRDPDRPDQHVVLDRYYAEGTAYGKADGLDAYWLGQIQRFMPAPDLRVFIDVPVEVALERMRGRKLDQNESRANYLQGCAENFKEMWRLGRLTGPASRWLTLDGRADTITLSRAVNRAVTLLRTDVASTR